MMGLLCGIFILRLIQFAQSQIQMKLLAGQYCEQQNNSTLQTQQGITVIKQYHEWKSFSALQTILLTTILRANKLKILVLSRIMSYRKELSDLLLLQQDLFLLY